MPVTVFPRQQSHTRPDFFTGPKLASAVGHILIGYWIYWILQHNAGGQVVQRFLMLAGKSDEDAAGYVTPVQGDRVPFLVLFATLYGLRWGLLGAFTTNAGNAMPWNATIQVVFLHTMLYVMTMTVFATTRGGLPADLTSWDYAALALSIVAGILQHGAELQRLLFKLDPSNKGKLHTAGLFGQARFINHTGHVLQDIALAIATRNWPVGIMALVGINLIFFQITPETEAHMQSKYKEKYDKYCQQTPHRFIPYIW